VNRAVRNQVWGRNFRMFATYMGETHRCGIVSNGFVAMYTSP